MCGCVCVCVCVCVCGCVCVCDITPNRHLEPSHWQRTCKDVLLTYICYFVYSLLHFNSAMVKEIIRFLDISRTFLPLPPVSFCVSVLTPSLRVGGPFSFASCINICFLVLVFCSVPSKLDIQCQVRRLVGGGGGGQSNPPCPST